MVKSAENRMHSNLELLPVMNVKSRPQYISALKKPRPRYISVMNVKSRPQYISVLKKSRPRYISAQRISTLI
jgi:hypothetical protein